MEQPTCPRDVPDGRTERPRPRKGTKMNKRLAAEIKKLVLETMEEQRLIDMKKQRLLEIAANGQHRPHDFSGWGKTITARAAGKALGEIRNLKPHWFKEAKPALSFETVIQRLLNAHRSPAYKAIATRSLRAYAEARAKEIGSTPAAVAAGVKASATKRMKKAKPTISVAPETAPDVKSA